MLALSSMYSPVHDSPEVCAGEEDVGQSGRVHRGSRGHASFCFLVFVGGFIAHQFIPSVERAEFAESWVPQKSALQQPPPKPQICDEGVPGLGDAEHVDRGRVAGKDRKRNRDLLAGSCLAEFGFEEILFEKIYSRSAMSRTLACWSWPSSWKRERGKDVGIYLFWGKISKAWMSGLGRGACGLWQSSCWMVEIIYFCFLTEYCMTEYCLSEYFYDGIFIWRVAFCCDVVWQNNVWRNIIWQNIIRQDIVWHNIVWRNIVEQIVWQNIICREIALLDFVWLDAVSWV